MRIFERTIFAVILGAIPVATQAFAFDGAPVNQDTAIPVAGAAATLKKAIPPSAPDTSLTSLQYAAEGGHPVAQWKLGRMYADGEASGSQQFQARLAPEVQFADVVRSAGGHGETVSDPDAVRPAVERCFTSIRSGKAALLHVKVPQI